MLHTAGLMRKVIAKHKHRIQVQMEAQQLSAYENCLTYLVGKGGRRAV